MDNLLLELKQESTILDRNEEGKYAQCPEPLSPISDSSQAETETDSSATEDNQQEQETRSSSEDSTLSAQDSNIPLQENTSKGEKQSQGNSNDAYIAKLLEKLIKERDRLVELGILMSQNDPSSKRFSSLVAPNKSNQENMDPAEEGSSYKSSKKRATGYNEQRISVNNGNRLLEEREIVEEDEEARQIKLKQAAQARLRNMRIEDLLHISRKEANFGTNLPGQIVEEALEIVNKSGENLVVEILIDCLNEELQDTDEYVYSIRRSNAYDYNDKHYLIMAPFSSASFRLALKVPSIRINDDIKGQARISIQGAQGRQIISMISGVVIPKVFCPRELFYKPLKSNIIKLAIKQGKKLESKIPLKNLGDVQITLDFDFHKSKESSNNKFDCFVYPTSVTIPAGGMAIVTVMLKYIGGGSKDNKDLLKKVLIGRARDSALIYSFLLWIETY